MNASLRRENEKLAKRPLEAVAKALEEDPSIFEYDSLYDEMAERKKKADPRLQKKDTKVGGASRSLVPRPHRKMGERPRNEVVCLPL